MLAITQSITFFYVRDLQATAAFYEGALGLPLQIDQGTCRIYRVSADGWIGFCERADAPEPDGTIITLVTPDVDGWYAMLRAKGVQFEKTPQENPHYRIYHCFLRDPAGRLVEIQRFLD
ncbi:MAG: VOC family protein [Anaerolineales bacterium]|nr:VOC family protein [Anaerolineales bacterium]